MKYYSLLLIITLSISSCVSKKKYNELGQDYEDVQLALSKARKEIADLKHNQKAKELTGEKEIPITTYKFDKLSHNFTNIALGYEYTTTFSFTNTGQEDLIFTSVKGSCTCTVPEYPKEPIKPGESGTITVKFTPGMPLGEQTKYVTIMANTKRKVAVLSVTGNVRKN